MSVPFFFSSAAQAQVYDIVIDEDKTETVQLTKPGLTVHVVPNVTINEPSGAGINGGSGNTWEITNDGTIYGYANGIVLDGPNSVVVNNGEISSRFSTIKTSSSLTLVNSETGVINSEFWSAIEVGATGLADITNAGVISGGYVIVLQNVAGSQGHRIVNSGQIGRVDDAIQIVGGPTSGTGKNLIHNLDGGLVYTTSSHVGAIHLLRGTTQIVNEAGATIRGVSAAIFNQDLITISDVENSGLIEASDGVATFIYGGGRVDNYAGGVIEGLGGLSFVRPRDGLATLVNAGRITGHGTSFEGGNTRFRAGIGAGLYIGAGLNAVGRMTEITNEATGIIEGGVYGIYSGSAVDSGEAPYLILDNKGVIQGGTGIWISDNWARMVNSGTITGTDGVAIRFDRNRDDGWGTPRNHLTLLTGSVINGAVYGSDGLDDMLILEGVGSEDLSKFINFGHFFIEDFIESGANWTLSGSAHFAESVQIFEGRVDLTGHMSSPWFHIFAWGTLAGTGTVTAPAVRLEGTLSPGSAGGVGTLTLDADLEMAASAVLDFQLGEANVVGGDHNDFIQVSGNLTLDGTLNVTPTNGSTLDGGIYRLIEYGGALTNNGLALGDVPVGSDLTVQTAIAGQVNLINMAGLDLSFWDGAVGPKFDGVVNGGDGIWQAASGNDNWTEPTGLLNGGFLDRSFAVFAGTAGNVTVDASLGPITVTGMQFAANGYHVAGDAINLAEGDVLVRVGDGSRRGLAYFAEIAAPLTGAGRLVKADYGALILSGVNSYTGGTAINDGILQVASDQNLGDAAGELSFDGGILYTTAGFETTRSVDLAGAGTFRTEGGTELALQGAITGAGSLRKEGAGKLLLAGDNSYSGGTTISEGELQLGDGGTRGSVTGDIVNNATLRIDRADELLLDGMISGSGALVQQGAGTTILARDNSYAGGTTISMGALQLGNGGTSGWVAGDIANDGRLIFNRSDNFMTFGNLISGTGAVEQAGSGTLILTAANNYTGATNVTAGTMFINGDQSGATGVTTVAAGGTLGGTGIVGGDLVVADGGTLSPGVNGSGTLTVNGNMALAETAKLDFDFGLPNAPGDALNDVVDIAGDLTLDGTIDIRVTPGGGFGLGLYRIANYGGALTDNGLEIGAIPTDHNIFVQTSVAGEVNLINAGTANLSFWDGDAGPKFDGVVNGGDGVWQNSLGNDNWTEGTGAVNASFADDTFAIFAGDAGNVTIDNSLGAVSVAGMQFATSGYVITGDALTLGAPETVVRVGDGSRAGAEYLATIDSEVIGTGQLVKADGGTLVLTGDNSYSGGTAINGGVVRVASNANLGDLAGGLSFDGGTLQTTADMQSDRAIDLAGTGGFRTDAGTTLTLGGSMGGAGGFTKSGDGTLVLAGSGSYAGASQVNAGSLFVNGDYSGANGAMTVATGASLGGAGIIGGDVIMGDGSTLTPGQNGAGTLTIAGGLTLSNSTRLAFDLGEANAVGGAFNDLIEVGGDLTLNGTLDVTVPVGGAFDVGIYRLINYGGTLIDQGLGLGTLPPDADVAVQTAIRGQVNLVSRGDLTLSFWDGAAGPKDDGVINGGDGVWQNSLGNDNWTDADGAVNAPFADESFAVFSGEAGTVTVDNSLGQVSVAGMQFATDGYTILGDDIVLAGAEAIIRVGDGDARRAGPTATIDAVLTGGARLVKTDIGTLVLTGANSYAGGTAINGGTIRISDDNNLGAATGLVSFDGGRLETTQDISSARNFDFAGAGVVDTAADSVFTHDGLFSGTGSFTKTGAGTMVLTGVSDAFGGAATVSAGTLAVMGSLGGTMNLQRGARLEGTGSVGALTNNGIVAPGRGGFGTLTVNGDYTASVGALEMDVVLGDDNSQTDRLVITGNVSGTTFIDVTNVGGRGAATVEGIKLIDVGGLSAAGSFVLNGDYVIEGRPTIVAGAYGYSLYRGGVSTPDDGDWYLRAGSGGIMPPISPYQPGVPVYETYVATLQTLNRPSTLQQRVGNRQWSGFTQGGVGMWGRMDSNRRRPQAAFSATGADLDINDWSLQAGLDAALIDISAGTLIAGVQGRYGKTSAQTSTEKLGHGSIDMQGYGVGATLTWYDSTGFYADAQAQFGWYRSDLESSILGRLVDNNDGTGEAFSLELGKRAPIGGGMSVTPQMQMVYSNVRFDAFTDPYQASVAASKGDSLESRWGISLDHQASWGAAENKQSSHLYGLVNLSYEWLDGSVVDVSGASIERRHDRLWGSLGLGGSYAFGGGRYMLYTEISAQTALKNFGDSHRLNGTAGFRMKF
ncbi:autotransporter outer membrane beta-barrel domain-containing protein [Sphingopyxis sp. MWB1]|uniref:autotransporter outer membrane beta-barrel domain-containing protein n=1 Tax=Sphingopyxis sp. MWB1 TaxID=1537715 RepID=UPI00056B6725|nr:autotransporter outer membrane beta-barrel domain-containing protein [Sphingopyxis sp. MWB1]